MTPTELRRQLRGDGYDPLPLTGKAPELKGSQEKFGTIEGGIDLWGTTCRLPDGCSLGCSRICSSIC
jgi:hypothetical protein